MKPTKKQIAMALAALLSAIATALYQCPDDPPREGVTVTGADAGAALELDMHDVTRTVVQIGAGVP